MAATQAQRSKQAAAGQRPALSPETGDTWLPPAVVDRLDEVAQVIIAEVGLDMGQFPTPAHLVSWARLSPRTIQSGAKHRAGTTRKGNPTSRPRWREAAAAKTDTFLGERYRRLVRRIGKGKRWSVWPAPSW